MRKKRASIVRKHLENLFPDPPIPLNHTDPFTLLVAVALSAQCTDERVNLITPKLFQVASTPAKMADLPEDQLKSLIQTCGLANTKAKNLKKMAQMLLDDFDGQVPPSIEKMKKLPGVGQKTASVVLAQAFGKPAIGVDTHILRCSKRWGLTAHTDPSRVEEDLKKLYPKSIWRQIHLQMIYYARTYCPARGHHTENCPICTELDLLVN